MPIVGPWSYTRAAACVFRVVPGRIDARVDARSARRAARGSRPVIGAANRDDEFVLFGTCTPSSGTTTSISDENYVWLSANGPRHCLRRP